MPQLAILLMGRMLHVTHYVNRVVGTYRSFLVKKTEKTFCPKTKYFSYFSNIFVKSSVAGLSFIHQCGIT